MGAIRELIPGLELKNSSVRSLLPARITTSLSRPVFHYLKQDLFGLWRCLPDVLSDQVVAHGMHQVPLVHVAEPVQQLSHPRGDVGLSGAGRPVKHVPQAGNSRRPSRGLPGPPVRQGVWDA